MSQKSSDSQAISFVSQPLKRDRRHIGRVQEIAETSTSAVEYEARINYRFGDQRELDFVTPPNVTIPTAAKTTQSAAADAPLPLFDRLSEISGKEAAN